MEINEARKHVLEITRKQEYAGFCFWVNEEINKLHSRMEVVKDPFELGTLQGCIKIYRKMLQLEKEVTNL